MATKSKKSDSGTRRSLPPPKVGNVLQAERVRFVARERNSKLAPIVEAILEIEEGQLLPFATSDGESVEDLHQRISSLVSRACQKHAEEGYVYRVRLLEDGRVGVQYMPGVRRARKPNADKKKDAKKVG